MKAVFVLLPALAGLLSACSNRNFVDSHVVMHTDFENLAGWVPEAQLATLTQEQAHSGRYALKAGAGQEFSFTFNRALGQTFDTRPAKIKLTAWVRTTAPKSEAIVVMGLNAPETPDTKPLSWTGIRLDEKAPEPHRWVKVSAVAEVPATATPQSRLTIYLWNRGAQPAYLDDIVVEQQ